MNVPTGNTSYNPSKTHKRRINNFNEARERFHRGLGALEKLRLDLMKDGLHNVYNQPEGTEHPRSDEYEEVLKKYSAARDGINEAINALSIEELRHVVGDMVEGEIITGAPHPVEYGYNLD